MDSGIELPARAERPQIDASGFDYPALYINLCGDVDQGNLHELVKRLRQALLAQFSGVVIFASLFSMLESKFILPAHLARIDIDTPPRWLAARLWKTVQQAAQAALYFLRDRCYVPLLLVTVRYRYAALILFVSVATLALGLTMKGKVKSVFFPEVPGQIISVILEMDRSASVELTRANVERIRDVRHVGSGWRRRER
jgi:multidrug efflux pump subunit AcrB